ncbi:MAG: rhodanese-like domain-containing protein [Syntrophobacteraceae bacterium]
MKETMTYTPRNRRWLQAILQSGAIFFIAAVFGLTVNHVRSSRLALIADWSPKAQSASSHSGENLHIPLEEAEVLYFSQQAVFIDARSEEFYRMGHVQGARNLPWNSFDSKFAETMLGVSLDTPLITYCDGEGCGISNELALALIDKGFTNVHVLVNGWSVWQQANLPTEWVSP